MSSSPSGNAVLHRWIIINALLIAVFSVSYANGYLDSYVVDETFVTHIIMGTFLLFLINSFYTAIGIRKAWRQVEEISLWYDSMRAADRGPEAREILVEKSTRALAWSKFAGPFLVLMGLFGTILGIINGFTDLTPDVVVDTSKSQAALATLLAGMTTAFNTTLVGITGMAWNMVNLHLLRQEMSRLYAGVLDK